MTVPVGPTLERFALKGRMAKIRGQLAGYPAARWDRYRCVTILLIGKMLGFPARRAQPQADSLLLFEAVWANRPCVF